MKRIVSIVLTLTLLLSCVCFFVSAESEGYSGVYNGYNYYCYGQVTPDSCTVSMTYANSTPTIMIDGFYKYKNSDYQVFTEEFFMRGKLNTFVNNLPDDLLYFISLTSNYYVGSTRVVYLPLSAT